METRKIFVDGQEGTTGLQIRERLAKNSRVQILEIDQDKRKDPEEKRKIINNADLVFLCLPDEAARESAKLVDKDNEKTKVIDASTAHRISEDWVYGMPELDRGGQRELIKNAQFVSNPGCHSTAFVLPMRPLVKEGIVPADYPVACHSVTGYSGAGKKAITLYESGVNELLKIPRHYALSLSHKHLPEMKTHCGLEREPLFNPIICDFYKGLVVTIPLYTHLLKKGQTAEKIHSFLSDYYKDEQFVKVIPFGTKEGLDNGFFQITELNDTNFAHIYVFGDDDRVSLMTKIDNLGKGASGAAVQNMNIMLGFDEGETL